MHYDRDSQAGLVGGHAYDEDVRKIPCIGNSV